MGSYVSMSSSHATNSDSQLLTQIINVTFIFE